MTLTIKPVEFGTIIGPLTCAICGKTIGYAPSFFPLSPMPRLYCSMECIHQEFEAQGQVTLYRYRRPSGKV